MANFFSSGAVSPAWRRPRGHGIQTFDSHFGALSPRPIEDSCIEEGSPVARCTTLTQSPDERLSSGLWECTAGKFKVAFSLDEIVTILDGEVTVHEDGEGHSYRLGVGDAAYFPLGLVTHWEVPRFVRKFFVVRVPGGNSRVARFRQRFAI
jgi:uncharacterized protein